MNLQILGNFPVRFAALTLVGLLGVVGCATTGAPGLVEARKSDLDRWVDEQMVPYVVKELNDNPRLKGRPFVVVGMHEDDTKSDIDALSQRIRQRLQDGLASAPGSRLLWQPAARRGQHHRSLEQVQCGASSQQPAVQVGIDAATVGGNGPLRVSIRAVDLDENQWVPGFARVYEGAATSAEREAMTRTSADETLRGLRALPFNGAQPDLLAAYLAANLSCLLREIRETNLVLYVPPIEQGPAYFATTLNLVGNYLGRFNEVRLTTNAADATVALQPQVYNLTPGMYQVWTRMAVVGQGRVIGGTDTAAYVDLSEQPAPRVTNIGLVTTPEKDAFSLAVVAPASVNGCRAADPWSGGERRVKDGEVLPAKGCMAIDLRVTKPISVAVFMQSDDGQVMRLAPNACGAVGVGAALEVSSHTRLPALPGHESVLDFDGGRQVEWIYAVAAWTAEGKRTLDVLANTVPDSCAGGEHFLGVSKFQSELERLSHAPGMAWKAAWFEHE